MKTLLLSALACLLSWAAFAQSTYSRDPEQAQFITRDVESFWHAYDQFWKDTTANPFADYIKTGSPGVQGFMDGRIESAANLKAAVKAHRAEYDANRAMSLRPKETEKQCRAAFYALKHLYPAARFPPVYFVVGVFNSGGTSNQYGIIIGAEKLTGLDHLPYLVAHELIHYQQANWQGQPTLLEQSITEGAADFAGELISGRNMNQASLNYFDAHKDALCREFAARMDKTDYDDWLYGTSGKDARPNDLGYSMGYRIAQACYAKAADKRKALAQILTPKDAKALLMQSGYLDAYLTKK